MIYKRFCRSTFAAIVLGLLATNASGEELSVATFVPPQHHTNTLMFKWFGDELAGLPMSLKGAESFDGADDRSKKMIADADKGYEWTVVSDDERAKMDEAVATGLKEIFADYASRGISNAEEIYNALNN